MSIKIDNLDTTNFQYASKKLRKIRHWEHISFHGREDQLDRLQGDQRATLDKKCPFDADCDGKAGPIRQLCSRGHLIKKDVTVCHVCNEDVYEHLDLCPGF